MSVYEWLLLAHFLYDFHWQGDFIGVYKAKNDFLLAVHSVTWALILCAVLYKFGVARWWTVYWLSITHFVIDRWKARSPNDDKKLSVRLWIDQALHLITVIVVFAFG